MQFSLRIIKIVALFVLIASFFTIGFKLNEKEDEKFQTVKYPKTTIFHLKIKPTDIIFEFALYTIFDSKDQELINQLKDEDGSGIVGSKEKNDIYGLDFSSDIDLFILRNSIHVFPVLKMKVQDETKIKNNLNHLNYYIQGDEVYLTFKNNSLNDFKKTENLNELTLDKNQVFSFHEFSNQSLFSRSKINLGNHKILIGTEYETVFDNRNFIEDEDGLTMAFELTDEFQNLLKPFYNSVDTNKISYINIVYNGFDFERKFPDFNLIIEFENDVSIKDWLKNVFTYFKNFDEFGIIDNTVTTSFQNLIFKKIDKRSYEIGLNELISPQQKIVPPRYIEGNIETFLRINNAPLLLKGVIMASTFYRSISNVFDQFHPVRTEINAKDKKSTIILELKNNQSFYGFLSNVLKSQSFKDLMNLLESENSN